MKFYVDWRSDSGVTERKGGRTKTKRRKKYKRNEGNKKRKENRGEGKSAGRQELQRRRKNSEGGEVDEKECEERNVGGFQRRTRGTVATARRDVSRLSACFLARIQSD